MEERAESLVSKVAGRGPAVEKVLDIWDFIDMVFEML